MRQAATSRNSVAGRDAAGMRAGIFAALIALVWISTEPFRVAGVDATTTGNIVNQIAFSGGAALALAALALVNRAALTAYLRPVYLLLFLSMTTSVLLSLEPSASMRAFAFTLVVLIIAGCAMVLPAGREDFAMALGLAALGVVIISYLGLVLAPGAAIHTAGDMLEPEHAGSWRGLFDHKNIAGMMMAFFAMIGLFVAQVRSRLIGWTLFGLAVVFLYFTHAKTSGALFPLTLIVAALAERIRNPFLRGLLCLGPLAVLITFTLGSVLIEPVHDLLEVISPGQTFTGRTEIWEFAFRKLALRPWTGFGMEGFWGSDFVRFSELREGETGIALGMVHGHNGYVDLVVAMGIPGLILSCLALLILPLVDFHRARRFAENAPFARLYLRIWLFAIHAACLESFFFRRADPVWFTLLIAILGLRLVSLWRVAK